MTRWLREFIYTHPIIFIYLAGRDKDVLIGLVKRNIQDSLEYYHYYNFIYVSFVAVYIYRRVLYIIISYGAYVKRSAKWRILQ